MGIARVNIRKPHRMVLGAADSATDATVHTSQKTVPEKLAKAIRRRRPRKGGV